MVGTRRGLAQLDLIDSRNELLVSWSAYADYLLSTGDAVDEVDPRPPTLLHFLAYRRVLVLAPPLVFAQDTARIANLCHRLRGALWAVLFGPDARKERSVILQGFKQFMLRGNVIDLAVAVVMGAAFGSVVSALVKDLITPFIAVRSSASPISRLSSPPSMAASSQWVNS